LTRHQECPGAHTADIGTWLAGREAGAEAPETGPRLGHPQSGCGPRLGHPQSGWGPEAGTPARLARLGRGLDTHNLGVPALPALPAGCPFWVGVPVLPVGVPALPALPAGCPFWVGVPVLPVLPARSARAIWVSPSCVPVLRVSCDSVFAPPAESGLFEPVPENQVRIDTDRDDRR
jgi:hypothetical protein